MVMSKCVFAETPSPNVTCHGTMLDACFRLAGGTTTGIDKSHFRMQPLCKEATVDDTLDVLCYHIDFTICTPASSLVSVAYSSQSHAVGPTSNCVSCVCNRSITFHSLHNR